MPKLYGLYRFPNTSAADAYETDDGRLFALNGRFVAPPDIDAAGVTNIIASIPGAEQRFVGDPSICPTDSVEGRKITYYRSNGSSISLVAPIRTAAAGGIADVISSNVAAIEAAGNFPVICAALEGETLKDIYDIYVPPSKTVITPATIGNRPLAAAGIQYWYTGTMQYQTDYDPFGSVRIKPFKIASNLEDAVPTLWAGIINAAPFNLLPSALPACGGNSDKRVPRHFIVTNAIGAALATALPQQTKIPFVPSAIATIAAQAAVLAEVPSTICLEYKGESNPRLWRS